MVNMGVGDSYLKNHIIELRNERSWTQQQLADALQVSRQTVISIEKNKYMPSLKLAFRIAEVFQKSIYDVFDYKGGD
jgi:putative transcriptional regulator